MGEVLSPSVIPGSKGRSHRIGQRWLLRLAGVPLLVALANPAASLPIVVVPTGLNPGDQYRLAFVTSQTRNAESGDIADYNSFVAALANAVPELNALDTTWYAIASTSAVDARTNTGTDPTPPGPTGVPIFLVVDIKVAEDYDDLWDGTILAALRFTELGELPSDVNIWTGTNPDGTGSAGNQLGIGRPIIGASIVIDSGWINRGTQRSQFELHPLYGISGVLTVAPAPSPAGLLGIGAIGLVLVARRGRRGVA